MNQSLNYESTIQLYVQISEDLRMNIISEKWKPGTKIPPELELCEKLFVAR